MDVAWSEAVYVAVEHCGAIYTDNFATACGNDIARA
jgi:hypothetical protein